IGSFVVYKQIKFVNEQDLGFNMTKMLIVKAPQLTGWRATFIERENSVTSEIKGIPNVLGAANSGRLPGAELGRAFNVRRADAPRETHFPVRNNSISKDFIDLYQMKLLAGRNFISTVCSPDWDKLHNLII